MYGDIPMRNAFGMDIEKQTLILNEVIGIDELDEGKISRDKMFKQISKRSNAIKQINDRFIQYVERFVGPRLYHDTKIKSGLS